MLLETKHGALECDMKLIRFLSWHLESYSDEIVGLGLKQVVEKEYGRTFLLNFIDNDESSQDRCYITIRAEDIRIGDVQYDKYYAETLAPLLKKGVISLESELAFIMYDLARKHVLIEGEYVVYV